MAVEIVLGTAVQQLVRVIEQQTEADSRFESILNNLKSTLESAYPKICEIYELRESNDLPTDELQRLLELMNQATETIHKYYRVTCWNYCKKRKYMKELLRIDASLRNFFLVNLLIDQYNNITLIQVHLGQLRTCKSNASRRVFHPGQYKVSGAANELNNFDQYKVSGAANELNNFDRYKVSGAANELNNFDRYKVSGAANELNNYVRSLRSWMLLFWRSVMIPSRGYQRINN